MLNVASFILSAKSDVLDGIMLDIGGRGERY